MAVVDLFTGLYASNAVLAALLHARATGQGQHIDVALFDVQAAMLANQATNFFVSGKAPGRMGNAHPNLAPYQPFATADGAVVIAVGNDGQFRNLCRAIGAADLGEDSRFVTNALRVENRVELITALAPFLTLQGTDAWIGALEAAGVPCGPINTVDRVFAEPQAGHRGLVVDQARADLAETVQTVASPIRLSQTPVSYRHAPPALGADTETVLGEALGLSADEIATLRQAGVV